MGDVSYYVYIQQCTAAGKEVEGNPAARERDRQTDKEKESMVDFLFVKSPEKKRRQLPGQFQSLLNIHNTPMQLAARTDQTAIIEVDIYILCEIDRQEEMKRERCSTDLAPKVIVCLSIRSLSPRSAQRYMGS